MIAIGTISEILTLMRFGDPFLQHAAQLVTKISEGLKSKVHIAQKGINLFQLSFW